MQGRVCRSLFVATVLFSAALGVHAQTTAPQNQTDATVEVAVVRPHPAAVMHNNFSFQKNRFELEDQPLLKLIAFAYSLNSRQIVGAPEWVEEKHWDMSRTTNLTADATLPQEQQLVRQLLKERFGLQFHREKREMPAYALQVVNGQPKLTAAADPSSAAAGADPRKHDHQDRELQKQYDDGFHPDQAAVHGPAGSRPDRADRAIRLQANLHPRRRAGCRHRCGCATHAVHGDQGTAGG